MGRLGDVTQAARDAAPTTVAGRLAVSGLTAGLAVAGAAALEVRRRVVTGRADTLGANADTLRSVATRMTTPLLPDDYLRLLNPLWTTRELRGRIVDVRPETDDAATLVITPGWGWRFDHKPGQYVGIGIRVDGKWHWRSYSISSAPSQGRGTISITVKAMPEGFLSSHLVRGLDPGTIVRLALPQGEFVLPEPPPAKILFWTGGSGITPVMAMLRTLDRRGSMPDIVHVHSAPSADAVLFREELHRLAARHDSLTVIENDDDVDGRLEVADLLRLVPDWKDREAWVCGPGPMLDAAEERWNDAHLADSLHLERFNAQLSASAEGGHVTFADSGKETDIDGATTLLEAGEALGITMPFGCRMGICHTCVVPLTKGVVTDLRNGTEYHDNQEVQTCVTAAAGDCVLAI